MSAELSSGDIAKLYGISRYKAHRLLRDIETKHGPTIVCRRGNRRFTTRAALEQVAPRPIGDKKHLAELQQRVEDTENRLDIATTELRAVKKEVNDLKETYFAWMRGVAPNK